MGEASGPSSDGATADADAVVSKASARWDPPTTPLDANGQGVPYATYGFAAQMAEVEVDIVLGTVKVLEIVAAHDVGRAINPTLVEGQIHGGIAQGLGLALMEEFIPGRTENLHDYLIPTVGDMPPVKTYLIEDPEPDGPVRRQGRRRAGADRHRARHPLRHPPRHRRAHHPRAGAAAPAVGSAAGSRSAMSSRTARASSPREAGDASADSRLHSDPCLRARLRRRASGRQAAP